MKNYFISSALLSMTALLSACVTLPSLPVRPGYIRAATPVASRPVARCYECGTVESIETVYNARTNTRTGAVLGGIVGGVLGNQVGEGDGKKAATVAGAVAGATAGNAIENKRNEQTFDIKVRMDDGRHLIINQNTVAPNLRVGSYVRITGGRVVLLR